MVTSVPPDSGPRLGVRKLTAGVCGKTRRSAVLLPVPGEQKKTLFQEEQQNGDVSQTPDKPPAEMLSPAGKETHLGEVTASSAWAK